jgi:hypothetical protein
MISGFVGLIFCFRMIRSLYILKNNWYDRNYSRRRVVDGDKLTSKVLKQEKNVSLAFFHVRVYVFRYFEVWILFNIQRGSSTNFETACHMFS